MRSDDRPDESRCDVCGRRAGRHAADCDYAPFDETPRKPALANPSPENLEPQASHVK